MKTVIKKAFSILKSCRGISIYKTLLFNLKYFTFKDAIKLPVLISRNVILSKTEGELTINNQLRTGMVLIGFTFRDSFQFDVNESKTIWNVSGKVIFGDNIFIGVGSKIIVTKNGRLDLGDNFSITAKTSIISEKSICFGKNCMISWDVLIMDHDGHAILNKITKEMCNPAREITFGDKVWIGCRTIIFKGTKVEKGCIIAANTFLNKEIEGENQIIAGYPAEIIKKEIRWFS